MTDYLKTLGYVVAAGGVGYLGYQYFTDKSSPPSPPPPKRNYYYTGVNIPGGHHMTIATLGKRTSDEITDHAKDLEKHFSNTKPFDISFHEKLDDFGNRPAIRAKINDSKALEEVEDYHKKYYDPGNGTRHNDYNPHVTCDDYDISRKEIGDRFKADKISVVRAKDKEVVYSVKLDK